MLTVLGKEGLRAWELEGPRSLSSNFNAAGNLSTPQKYLLFTSEQRDQSTSTNTAFHIRCETNNQNGLHNQRC